MKKIVNVNAVHPIPGVRQIVRGRLDKAEMSTEDIFKCLCAKATVTEVVGDKLIPLNFDNYNKNNKPVDEPVAIPTTPVVNNNTNPVLSDYDKKNIDLIGVDNNTSEVAETTAVSVNLFDETKVADEVVVETATEATDETVTESVSSEEVINGEAPVIEETSDGAVTETSTELEENCSSDNSVPEVNSTSHNNHNNRRHKR